MNEKNYFSETFNLKISIASISTHSSDLKVLEEDSVTLSKALLFMRENTFDVLPLLNNKRKISSYYCTRLWGVFDVNNLIKRDINDFNSIYYLTNLSDTIDLFVERNINFFFLTNMKDINGLTTIADLNSKQVYIHLYNLITQIEKKMSEFLFLNGIDDNKQINVIESRKGSNNSKDALKRYFEDRNNGLERGFMEYLYLTDLAYILKKYGLLKDLSLSNNKFDSYIKQINELRKIVAHPNKTLVSDENSLKRLKKGINAIENLLIFLS